MADIIQVADVFVDRNIFITGGAGFIGKVLIEKLLRSCPGVNKLYILLRPRRGKTITERLEDISKLPLFEKLHSEMPGHFQTKVIPINGDVALPQLGLSSEDRQMLIENVSLVYHVAATVRFDEPLTNAILSNIRGTREICTLVLEMHRCDLMVHVSTAYAHTQYNPIEERMYPANADWRQCITAAEKLDTYDMSKLQSLIMGPFPNSYTYTKGLAEWVVYDMLNEKVPNQIIRPSIVISSWREPIPGWLDNFNGPVGFMIAIGMGISRINPMINNINDLLPVDIFVRILLNVTWYRLSQTPDYAMKRTSVHNSSSNAYDRIMARQLTDIGLKLIREAPFSTCLWYPSVRFTDSITEFQILFMILQLLPALFIDMILRLFNRKPMVLKIQRSIFIAINALQFFMLNSWAIKNQSLNKIEAELIPADLKDFSHEFDAMETEEFFRNAILGAKKYLIKDDFTKLKRNRRRMQFLKYLDLIWTMLIFAVMFYLLFIRWNVPQLALNYVGNYFDSLPTPLLYQHQSYH